MTKVGWGGVERKIEVVKKNSLGVEKKVEVVKKNSLGALQSFIATFLIK